MNNPNQDSKIPPARPEIIAEIVAVDCLLADLFLNCQQNAREVDELVRVLDNHLASCEDVRDTLLNLPFENSNPPLTMTDLPIFEQRMIVSTGLFSKMLLDTIQVLSNTTSLKICNNKTQARKDDCMKVNYSERIEDTVSELKIIMSQQRTVTRQTKSSGTLFVKIWFEPEHYKCS